MFTRFGVAEGWTLQEIRKGWSRDRKYRVQTRDGGVFLLRVSADTALEEKKREWARMETAAAAGLPMTAPVAFRHFPGEGEVHMLLTYLYGVELEAVLPALSPGVQYALGVQAGELLARLHQCIAPKPWGDLGARMRRKNALRLARYAACGLRLEKEAAYQGVLAHLPRHLVEAPPPALLHGDYHPGNMVRQPDGTLGILDFNRSEYGDPYEDFNRVAMFTAQRSPLFAWGQLQGYFQGPVPEDFYEALAWYAAGDCLGGLVWSMDFGAREVAGHRVRAARIHADFGGFSGGPPRWVAEAQAQLQGWCARRKDPGKKTTRSMVRIPFLGYNDGKKQNPPRGYRREWRL